MPCCVFPRKFPDRYLVEGSGERVPVVSYEQASPCAHSVALLLFIRQQLKPPLPPPSPPPPLPPLQFLRYLQDMVRCAGGSPVIGFLGMQGLNAVISCTEWAAEQTHPCFNNET